VVEGNVYEMYLFFVAWNISESMVTYHLYKLIFLMRTMIIPADGFTIPRFGFNLIDFEDVLSHPLGYSYLVG